MNNERGNVLFLILIAVALFAALSYAVTTSTRGSGNNSSNENAQVQAAVILNYATKMKTAIMRLRTKGCTPEQITFHNNVVTPMYWNPTTGSDETCWVFSPQGGGLNWELVPPAIAGNTPIAGSPHLDWYSAYYAFIGGLEVEGQGTTGNRPDSNDLIMAAPVTKDVCTAISEKLGVPIFEDPGSHAYSANPFNGSFANTATAIMGSSGYDNGELCIHETPWTQGTGYFYVQTLVAR